MTETSSTQQWCGLCSAYTSHDTTHHAAQGGPTPGDRTTVTYEGREYDAKIEEVRGRRMRVSFPLSRGRTHSIWVDVSPDGRS